MFFVFASVAWQSLFSLSLRGSVATAAIPRNKVRHIERKRNIPPNYRHRHYCKNQRNIKQEKQMEQEQRKILLICNTSTNVITFRVPLIRTLKAKGLKVSVIAFDDKRKEEIETEGVEFYCVSGSNTSLNPLKMLGLKGEYRKIIEKINPDIVFTFMLKPNTFGVLAAKKSGVKNIYSMVEGAGDAFSNNSLKWKIIRFVICKLYKKSFKGSKRVFFLNNDDKAEFVKRKLVKECQCEIVHGIGVDLQKFAYKPIINHKTFLMVARLVKTKGVFEYCKCARIVKRKYPEAQFNYLGGEHSLKVSDIQEYIDDGSINYLGETQNVLPYYENCTVNCLPSYREGFGLVIAEAGAVGRMSIACNVQGTKDAICDGYSGILVEPRNVDSLVKVVTSILNGKFNVEQMGKNARTFAEEHFDQTKINMQIIGSILEQ